MSTPTIGWRRFYAKLSSEQLVLAKRDVDAAGYLSETGKAMTDALTAEMRRRGLIKPEPENWASTAWHDSLWEQFTDRQLMALDTMARNVTVPAKHTSMIVETTELIDALQFEMEARGIGRYCSRHLELLASPDGCAVCLAELTAEDVGTHGETV